MAKLNAPLLSFGASGQIGKSLVFFPWKGLNVARQYVVPTNPNTVPQQDQRGYLRDAVTLIHSAQALAANPLDADDIRAYSLLGSTRPTPRTWFNEICKQIIDQLVAGKNYGIWDNCGVIAAADALDVDGVANPSVACTGAEAWYGTSKTALVNKVTMNVTNNYASVTIPGLVTGTKYYVQIRTTTPAGLIGFNSGIYSGTPT
jgi:hypothetical protein